MVFCVYVTISLLSQDNGDLVKDDNLSGRLPIRLFLVSASAKTRQTFVSTDLVLTTP